METFSIFSIKNHPISTKQRKGSLKGDEKDIGEVFLGSFRPCLFLKKVESQNLGLENLWTKQSISWGISSQKRQEKKERRPWDMERGSSKFQFGDPFGLQTAPSSSSSNSSRFLENQKKPVSLFWAEVCPVCTVYFLLLVQEILCWVTGLTQIQSPAKPE